jgi:hypothetical protein
MKVQAEFGAGFGPELAAYMRQVLDEPQVMLMGRVTYEEMAGLLASIERRTGRGNEPTA